MTAQSSESLYYNGEWKAMYTEPLESYLIDSGFGRNHFDPPDTACWRGYIGTWTVKENKLFLIDLKGNLKDRKESVNLNYLFPDQEEVFAAWYSGTVRIIDGELIAYRYAGYDSIYEYDLFLTFDKGVLIKSKRVNNNSLGKRFFRYLIRKMSNWIKDDDEWKENTFLTEK